MADFADLSSNNFLPGQTMDVGAYVRSGRSHIMLKATEGTGYTWGYGATIADQMHGAGGFAHRYHWLRPDQDPAAQGNAFVDAVAPHLKPGDLLMGDFETTYSNGKPIADPPDGQRAAQFTTWKNVVQSRLPAFEVTAYTGNWYLWQKPACIAALKGIRIFLSDYNGTVPDAQILNPYGLDLLVRQFTDKTTFPGIPGTADGNRWLVDPAHTAQGGGTPLDPAQPAQPIQGEEEMHYIVAGKNANGSASGHNWIVAADLSSRTFCSDITLFQALADGNVNYRNMPMSYDQLMAIPDVTDRDGKGAT